MNTDKVNRKLFGWHNKGELPILDKYILIEPSDEFKTDNNFAWTDEDLNNIYFIGKIIKFVLDDEKTFFIFNTNGIRVNSQKCNWGVFVKRWIYLDDIKDLFK